MSRDQDYFNCSEDYELDYVAGLYKKTADVKAWLKDKCKNGTINYTTHKELYKMLDDAGFERK